MKMSSSKRLQACNHGDYYLIKYCPQQPNPRLGQAWRPKSTNQVCNFAPREQKTSRTTHGTVQKFLLYHFNQSMGALKKEENILLPRTDSVTTHHQQHQSNQKNKKLKSRTASRSEQETMLPPTVNRPKREISKKKNIERIQQQRATGQRGEGESTRGGREEISDLATAPSPALGGEKILGFSRGFRGLGEGGKKEKGGCVNARRERGDGRPRCGWAASFRPRMHTASDGWRQRARGGGGVGGRERWGPHVSGRGSDGWREHAASGGGHMSEGRGVWVVGGLQAAADVPLTCHGGWWSPRVSLAKAGEKHGGGAWIYLWAGLV